MPASTFPPAIQTIMDEFIPICRKIAGDQPYAISVGGSLGKGTWDHHSDVDFRLFTDQRVAWPNENPDLWADCYAGMARWKERGVNIDGIWSRSVAEIDADLARWFNGDYQPVDMVWTIWGYHILTDINNQFVIEDPYGIIAAWKSRLSVYPPALKRTILEKKLASLRYWRTDYHYAHKVERGDVVFLAGLTAKLVHEMIEILFALNETYYVGDGSNLTFVEKFKVAPENFSQRVRAVLYPQGQNALYAQCSGLAELVDEVITLADI